MNITEQTEPPELSSPTSPTSNRGGANASLVDLNVLGVQSPLHANQNAHKLKSPSTKKTKDPDRSKGV